MDIAANDFCWKSFMRNSMPLQAIIDEASHVYFCTISTRVNQTNKIWPTRKMKNVHFTLICIKNDGKPTPKTVRSDTWDLGVRHRFRRCWNMNKFVTRSGWKQMFLHLFSTQKTLQVTLLPMDYNTLTDWTSFGQQLWIALLQYTRYFHSVSLFY